ncbi:YggS family pyridoxal phosphate-dependent enzyme [Caloranaerobacter sp. DY30410]|uniref:YggS family pyridoxal phosphate-dependent enzyme n=1 Tax=Caloranaerobacter sp. DY30410 TaxID=3238305 RepID=UPI003D02B8C3
MKANLEEVYKNIEEAALKTGRSLEDITLIAVTKTIDVDVINEAIKLGINNIGESRVQEILRKYDSIKGRPIWHMIGHLQTNKVKYIIDKIDLIHSLDRLSLAQELQKRAEQHNVFVNALIQVNIAEEKSKYGLYGDAVIPFVEEIIKYPKIKIKGLMTIAPYAENPEEVRYVFRQLKELSVEIEKRGYPNVEMKYLSMGMTNDYKIAIEEGSNMVRIGTGIFGGRNY